ncbi:hypothetical protein MTR72_22090 [Bradyrhizobium sp. ISRA442]|uniref:hypothetical protein n=1 Tax=Bradyrhizobium sp. ISRA442 TaxID=2866197 RepID=UPI00311AECD2
MQAHVQAPRSQLRKEGATWPTACAFASVAGLNAPLIAPLVTDAAILFLSGCLKTDDNSLQNNDTLSQSFAISHRAEDLVSQLAIRRCD